MLSSSKNLAGFWLDELGADEFDKIYWVDSAAGRHALSARTQTIQGWTTGVTERTMDEIQAWCMENDCGVRTSFDTFRFRNRKEMTVFLLRWSS